MDPTLPNPQSNQTSPYQRSADQVVADFAADVEKGLSAQEAAERLHKFGPNELTAEKPTPGWIKFLLQFTDVLVILLLIATAISAGLWVYERESTLPYEAIAIFAIVLLNAAIGYIQEARAESAVAALRRMSATHARVIRDGHQQSILTSELVPGDLILIEEGDTIPADARLISSIALQTAEAALTGESLPVAKDVEPISEDVGLGDRTNMVFSGTSATYGRGRAIVVGTGMASEMGRVAGMLKSVVKEATPLQKELDRVGKMLGAIVVVIAIVMIVTLFSTQNVHGFSAVFDVLIMGVALAVAAVPEGLPAIVTAVLALGVRRMAERNAIVRRLSAVETLGSASVIASDKTGTLTRNEMTVRAIVTAGGRVNLSGTGYAPVGEMSTPGRAEMTEAHRFELGRALAIADRANNAVLEETKGGWSVQGDPTEGALIVAARKAGLEAEQLDTRFKRVGEVPFSSERKLMSTVHTDAEEQQRLLVFTKGAPDVLLGRCHEELVGEEKRPLSDQRRKQILQANEELAAEALRTLAVAYRELPYDGGQTPEIDHHLERELVFAGLIGMIDPPRAEAADAVERANNAGIRPIMITGDHPKTAAVIATELGISTDGRVMTGSELEKADERQLAEAATEVSVYARVNPEHKLKIVKALQSHGAIVAMTGDGVNDAPALKMADIGVAMGITGTDVSKEAADIVLADDNFATIVAAVEGGRTIFANIRKFLRYLLSSNLGEVMTMFFGVLLADLIGLQAEGEALVLPLLATQILWINLVTDGAPALALGADPADPRVMSQPPRPVGEGVLTWRMWRGILFVGAIMAVGTLLVLDASLPGGLIEGSGTMRYGHTMAFTTLTLFQLFNVFNARSDQQSAFHQFFSNPWLWGAILLSFVLQVAVTYTPILQDAFSTQNLTVKDWLICAATASSVLWLREAVKGIARISTSTR